MRLVSYMVPVTHEQTCFKPEYRVHAWTTSVAEPKVRATCVSCGWEGMIDQPKKFPGWYNEDRNFMRGDVGIGVAEGRAR